VKRHRRQPARGRIEISLRSINQLFNSLDPSPFYERDLENHAENYLVSWAGELPADAPLSLKLHLAEPPAPQPAHWIESSIHHYFEERARLKRMELRALFRQGRLSLVIGLVFLGVCLLAGEWSTRLAPEGVLPSLLRESFMVAGWVAMWRPMQIYLYDWWPLRRQEKLYQRMSRMPVQVATAAAGDTPKPAHGRTPIPPLTQVIVPDGGRAESGRRIQ
jgi:hypothetical protein